MTSSILPFGRRPAFLTLQSVVPPDQRLARVGHLCFTLGEEEYGVDLKLVVQVLKPPPVTWVPRLSPHLLGVVAIRGSVVTLVDLRQVMGLSKTEWPRSARILIVEVGDEAVGLLVDSITQVRRMTLDQLETKPRLPDGVVEEYLIGVARPGQGTTVIVVDLDALLSEKLR